MRSDLVSPVIFIAFLCLRLSEQVWLLYFQQKHLVEQRRYFFLSKLAGNPSIFCFSCQYQYQYQYFILPAARKLSALRLIWLFRDWERCIRVPTIQQGLDLSNGDFNGFHNFNYHGIILLHPCLLFSCSSSEWDTVIEDGLNSIWSFQSKTLLNVQPQGQIFPLLNLLWSKTGNGKWPSAFAPTFHWILGEAIQMLRLVWNTIPVNLPGRTIERGNEKWPFTSETIISLHLTISSWQQPQRENVNAKCALSSVINALRHFILKGFGFLLVSQLRHTFQTPET